MLTPIFSILLLSTIGGVCANCSLLSLKIREQTGFPDHQVLKKRRLPSDAASRGGLFYSLFGGFVGGCVAMSHGFHSMSLLLTATSCAFGGLLISTARVRKLGEDYLKRAYENTVAKEFAAAIQDANEASRCGSRYRDEAQELVRAAKELRLCEQTFVKARAVTVASNRGEDRRKRSREKVW